MDTARRAGAPPYRGRPGSGTFRECITALVVTGGDERRGRDRRAGPACMKTVLAWPQSVLRWALDMLDTPLSPAR